VSVTTATHEDVPFSVTLPATLAPHTQATATAPRAGTVSIVQREPGDVVQRGDVVVTVQPDGHGRAAPANAPIHGVVLDVAVHLGDHADAHAPVATIYEPGTFVAHAAVPAATSDAIHVAQPAIFVSESEPDRALETVVARLGPAADASGNLPIEASLQD